MDTVADFIVFGIAVPAAVAGLPMMRGAAPRLPSGDLRLEWRVPAALGLAVWVAFVAIHGWPEEQWRFVALAPLAGGGIGAVMAMMRLGFGGRLVAYAMLGGATLACAWPVIEREPAVTWLVASGGPLVLAAGLEWIAVRRPGPTTALEWAVAAAASALVVLHSGYMTLAMAYGALPVALVAVACVAAVRRPQRLLVNGAVAVVAPLLVVVPLTAWIYADAGGAGLNAWSFVLPALAALSPGLLLVFRSKDGSGEVAPFRRPWLDVAAPLGLVALVSAAAILLAVIGAGDGEAEEIDPYADVYRDIMRGE